MSAMERSVKKHLSYVDERSSGWLLRPFLRYAHEIGERIHADLGLAYAHWTANGSGTVEPRGVLRMGLSEQSTLSVAAGIRSQLPPVQNFVVQQVWQSGSTVLRTDNSGLGLMRSTDLELGFAHQFRPHLRTGITAFVQQQNNIPVGPHTTGYSISGLSMVNVWDDITALSLDPSGEARMVGGELSFEHTFFSDLFYQVNVTLMDATYEDRLGKEYDSRWNTQYIGNVVFGHEFAKQNEKVKRTWGVSGRVNMTGGQRYTSTGSLEDPDPVPYGTAYPGTYRVDLRIYLRREREGRTGLWALDLLNATNAQNVAYRYFDFRQGKEVTKYQLGLIPNLSYRIEF